MIKVNVTKNGVITNTATFGTQNEADTWVNAQVILKSFGKPERWIDAEDLSTLGEDRANAISSQEVGGPEDARTQYKFAAEYTISQVDITAEHDAEQKVAKRLLKQSIGALVIAIATEINDSKNLSQEQLAYFLADQNLMMIERLAWSGSLELLAQAIQSYSGPFYTGLEKAKMLEPVTAFLASQA